MNQPKAHQPSDVRISVLSDDVFQNAEPTSPTNPYANSQRAKLPLDAKLSATAERPRSSGIGTLNSSYSHSSRIGSSSLSDVLGSSRNLQEKSNVQDGCLILGKDGGGSHTYVTRFRINTQLQRAHMGKELVKEECCPVCEEDNRETCGGAVFAFISGEAFLLSLHVSALLLGVAKEAFEVGKISTDLEIIHSTLETVVAVTQLLIRDQRESLSRKW